MVGEAVVVVGVVMVGEAAVVMGEGDGRGGSSYGG